MMALNSIKEFKALSPAIKIKRIRQQNRHPITGTWNPIKKQPDE